jgi:Zn finger protein HypA/HybF involved in hydrogenase expression
MVNTMVCEKDGCRGNRFKISVQRLKLVLICTECKGTQKYPREMNSNIPTICSACTGETFKVCKDVDKNEILFECMSCGRKFVFIPKE